MRVSHIGIAVRSLEQAGVSYGALFEGAEPHRETVEEQGVDVASYDANGVLIELTAATRDDSPIARFIEKRGEGIHHIAFEVDDIGSELERLKAAGVRLINEEPLLGAHGMYIAFAHPSSFNGVLLELCQRIDRAS